MTPLLPEHTTYKDKGCQHHPACLTCPFEQCISEVPVQVQRSKAKAAKARALRAEGRNVDGIAAALGMSRRSVFRMLKGARS